MNSFESRQPTESNADRNVLNELNAVRQEVYLMGANDSEIPEIDEIIERFNKGEIGREEALAQVSSIKNRKQDYH